MGDVAAVFHFPPSELWAMPMAELIMWHAQAVRIEAVHGG
ncbi:MAG: GpE family phage tail protein [Nitrospirota bacterium]|nr:GpE family phage tail protein [Nitrospirota bacterium]